MAWTKATSPALFFSKQDPTDPRLGENAVSHPLDDSDDLNALNAISALPAGVPVLLGYPDEEGIAMNGGRVGAASAPDTIRKYFYKMTPSLLNPVAQPIADLGNLELGIPLAERHLRGRKIIHAALNAGHKTFSLGGGHDYGYADGAGFLDHCATLNARPVIINFDAHLDVRPADNGFNSGTSFFRLLTDYPGQFDFVEIGLQNQCNSLQHLKWVQAQGAKTLLLEDIRTVGLLKLLEPLLDTFAGRPCFVSVDIDAFTSSEAPGCSQSWTSGLQFVEVSSALRLIQKRTQVLGLGIYEVSPPLDVENMTSKLAALILHQTLFPT